MEVQKLKIFESVKRHLASIDLDEDKPRFHRQQVLHVVKSFLALTLQYLYLVFDANTARDYMNSIFMTVVGVAVATSYWSAIFQMTTIYDFIDRYEKIITGSEFKDFFFTFEMSKNGK